MITIGVDAHKREHFAIAADETGRKLASCRDVNSMNGWARLSEWADRVGGPRQWGVEGAWNYGLGLAQHLVADGEVVYEVNPRWTAAGRRSARKVGKSDSLDAHAVAVVTIREAANLPQVSKEDDSAVLDLLTTVRESALDEATRLRNQIHQLLSRVDLEYHKHLPCLQTKAGLLALETYTVPHSDGIQLERAMAIRRMAQRLRLATSQVTDIAKRIKALTSERYEPLTQLCGINYLTAGALAGILGPGKRFTSDAQLAAYAGVAPIEASSAGIVRHRLNRGGNRRLNATLYRIALTQIRHSAQAKDYVSRRMAEGKTFREAFRALKRFIIRAVWHLWCQCQISTARCKLEEVVLT